MRKNAVMKNDCFRMPISRRIIVFCAGLLLCTVTGTIEAQESGAEKPASTEGTYSEKQREEQFAKQMANTVLVGYFTVDSAKLEQPGKPERYEIRKVTKAEKNMWVFQSRVKYGNVDTVLPILVPIEWAGDTPVVSMTDFSIPGMGTFTCRVMFYRDRYAGTWQHGKTGGHMWGKIEKTKP